MLKHHFAIFADDFELADTRAEARQREFLRREFHRQFIEDVDFSQLLLNVKIKSKWGYPIRAHIDIFPDPESNFPYYRDLRGVMQEKPGGWEFDCPELEYDDIKTCLYYKYDGIVYIPLVQLTREALSRIRKTAEELGIMGLVEKLSPARTDIGAFILQDSVVTSSSGRLTPIFNGGFDEEDWDTDPDLSLSEDLKNLLL